MDNLQHAALVKRLDRVIELLEGISRHMMSQQQVFTFPGYEPISPQNDEPFIIIQPQTWCSQETT